jgi:large subunit ribosomal protein L4
MNIPILNIKGEETGRNAKLDDKVFKIEPNDHAIYLDVKQYLANQRQGTHKSKERAEVAASTRKVKRQKGTGTARMGSLKSPLLRGGGRVFGPQPRDYGFKLNKKVKALARKSALAYKIKDNDLTILEDFNLDTPKTKTFIDILKSLALTDKKILMVIAKPDKNVVLSGRNLPKTKIALASNINTYDLLNAEKLVLCEGSIEVIENILN